MIQRDISPRLLSAAKTMPAITLTGPRGSGKTTLCRQLFSHLPYVSLESPDLRELATNDPRGFFNIYSNGAVIDEIQRVPDLLSYLQGIIDDDPIPGRWVIISSHDYLRNLKCGQSLAGRTAVHNLLPLSYDEIARLENSPKSLDEAILRGSYPSMHASGFKTDLRMSEWFQSYVADYIERDTRFISNIRDIDAFYRLIFLCAQHSGRLLKYDSLAKNIDKSQPTVKHWTDLMEIGFIVFRLPASFIPGMGKRLTKTPKLYFYDTGVLCWLLGIRSTEHLMSHPLRSKIFETWCISEIAKAKANYGKIGDLSFYRDSNGTETELMIGQPPNITLLGINSASEPSDNFFSDVRRTAKHLSRSADDIRKRVVCGSGSEKSWGEEVFIPWNGMIKSDLYE